MEETTTKRPFCAFCRKPFERQLVLWGQAEDVLVLFMESVALGKYGYAHERCAVGKRLGDEAARCSIRQLLNYEYSSRLDIELIRNMLPREVVHLIHRAWHPGPYPKETATLQPNTRPRENGKAGVVYVLHAQGTGRIKIGHSANFGVRLSTLQTASPYPLVVVKQIHTPDHTALEKSLHERFASYRQHGEWFELPQDVLMAFIAETFEENMSIKEYPITQQDRYVNEGFVICPKCRVLNIAMNNVDIRYREGNTDYGFNSMAVMTNDDEAAVHVLGNIHALQKNIKQIVHIMLECQECRQEFALRIARFLDGTICIVWAENA